MNRRYSNPYVGSTGARVSLLPALGKGSLPVLRSTFFTVSRVSLRNPPSHQTPPPDDVVQREDWQVEDTWLEDIWAGMEVGKQPDKQVFQSSLVLQPGYKVIFSEKSPKGLFYAARNKGSTYDTGKSTTLVQDMHFVLGTLPLKVMTLRYILSSKTIYIRIYLYLFTEK